VVILTYNEEVNLPQALASVSGWATEVVVLDSGSTDGTADVARAHGARLVSHPFENYGKQRNVGIDAVASSADWVLFLDADEWITAELRAEIDSAIAADSDVNGYFLRRRLMWRTQWIRRGYYPTWILRLVRVGKARCEERSVNEQMIVEGRTAQLTRDFIHEDRKGVGDWIDKHNRYATHEAVEAFRRDAGKAQLQGTPFGSQPQRARWLRTRIWNRLPPLVRPFIYFFYRYVLRGGFLDGREAFTYHFLQGLWYPLITDIKYLELRDAAKQRGTPSRSLAPASSRTEGSELSGRPTDKESP
jgi:glycosyltransferase involved in cell wall biosynthesis